MTFIYTLASFTVLVTAVLWTLWWDLSRNNLFLGAYLADTLFLLISETWHRIQAKPMFSASVAELTWVLWDSSWVGCVGQGTLTSLSHFLPSPLFSLIWPFYRSQKYIVFLKVFYQPLFLCLLSKKPLLPTNILNM